MQMYVQYIMIQDEIRSLLFFSLALLFILCDGGCIYVCMYVCMSASASGKVMISTASVFSSVLCAVRACVCDMV